MIDNPTIVDFLSESLKSAHNNGRVVLTPNQQQLADVLATLMDAKLTEIVSELEAVASCRQEESDVPEHEKKPPFEAFCYGLHKIGEALLPHLVQTYADAVKARGLEKSTFQWILDVRSDAYINYLMELACVHGVAFDDNLVAIGERERMILQQLEADLRTLYHSTFEAI
jgi:hypothetical protein